VVKIPLAVDETDLFHDRHRYKSIKFNGQ